MAVAMSGGVDSSTAAAMLHADGVPIVGLTMQLWNQRRLADSAGMPESRSGRCCSLEDVHDARRVAEQLGIPYYVVNLEERFEQDVVRPFVAEYRAGRTPIPCSRCNTDVKFDQLLATAQQIGADVVATGHYARVSRDAASGVFELRRALDEEKDQTYFLWGLNQTQLARAQFPLGGMVKEQVRAKAAELGLAVADKPDSNEICFVPGGNYAAFLDAYAREQGEPAEAVEGEFVASNGRVLGRHSGVANFTVGQRRGLGVATGERLYVLKLDANSQSVTLGSSEELMASELLARDCNWISGAAPSRAVRVCARIRHRHRPAAAWAEPIGASGLRVRFDEPQRAIAPGQAVVLYQDDRVIGGAWIESGG